MTKGQRKKKSKPNVFTATSLFVSVTTRGFILFLCKEITYVEITAITEPAKGTEM
jgi:hypothetical protein